MNKEILIKLDQLKEMIENSKFSDKKQMLITIQAIKDRLGF